MPAGEKIDVAEEVSVDQKVWVKVLTVDVQQQRIGLRYFVATRPEHASAAWIRWALLRSSCVACVAGVAGALFLFLCAVCAFAPPSECGLCSLSMKYAAHQTLIPAPLKRARAASNMQTRRPAQTRTRCR